MLRERSQSFKIAFIALDLLLGAIAFGLAMALHFAVISPEKIFQVRPDIEGIFSPGRLFTDNSLFILIGTYSYLGILICVSQVVVFIATDLYHPRRGGDPMREFAAIVRGVAMNLLVVLAVTSLYRGTTFSRNVILYNTMFSIAAFSLGHMLFRKSLERLRAKGYNTRNVLILGTGRSALRFIDTLTRHRIYGYRIVGLLGPKAKANPSIRRQIAGSFRDLKKAARQLEPDLVVYAMPADQERLQTVVDFCDSEGIDCRIIPEMVDLITAHARIEDMDGMPILTIRDAPLKNGYNRIVKRLFDICFSLLVLAAFSPLLLIIAFLIKWTSRGPALFKQERIGLDRKVFNVYKFRTMVVQDKNSSDTIWGKKSDSRVTRIGAFLRKTSLDEMPQFINVLKGDMSVVGPRPERPHFVQEFKSKYTHYMRRHAVKSGITGWAQVLGWRGDTSIQKRIEADIYYIENWSFWFDLVITIRTIPSMIKNPGE